MKEKNMIKDNRLITILGPTASGKTLLAVHLASLIDGEVLSADSRQVYKGMDVGTGKDLDDYKVNGRRIPYHLIDIVNAGESYDLFRFVKDFHRVYSDVVSRGRQPIMCGGSGMYLESIILGYRLPKSDNHPETEQMLREKSDDELIALLESRRKLHNKTDTSDRARLIKAVMVAMATENEVVDDKVKILDSVSHTVIGIDLPREVIRARITKRLYERLDTGLVDEVESLLKNGVTPDQLRYYGLEYRYITDYLMGVLDFEQMVAKLNTAIHQFAKRQMTWFRRMEKKNILIHWVKGNQDVTGLVNDVMEIVKN